jgi:hypothetical protein
VHAYVCIYTPSAYVLSEKRLELVFPSNNILEEKIKDTLDTFFFEKIYLCVFNFSVFFSRLLRFGWRAHARGKKCVNPEKRDRKEKGGMYTLNQCNTGLYARDFQV